MSPEWEEADETVLCLRHGNIARDPHIGSWLAVQLCTVVHARR